MGDDPAAGLKSAAIFGTSFGFVGGGLNGAVAGRLEKAVEAAHPVSIFNRARKETERLLLSSEVTEVFTVSSFNVVRANVRKEAIAELWKAAGLTIAVALPVLPEAILEGELG